MDVLLQHLAHLQLDGTPRPGRSRGHLTGAGRERVAAHDKMSDPHNPAVIRRAGVAAENAGASDVRGPLTSEALLTGHT